ncbi:hypothetical protein BY996DRAFT_6493188 [Phakopsora pachyrhizi]|nr:hypothetical protein BY996DRAFT_6493188 [Phakopsora pachyrhizi]
MSSIILQLLIATSLVGNPIQYSLILIRFHLLGGLTEVEEEQVGDLTDERVGYRSHLLAHQLTSDDYSSASPPSMTHSSSQTANSQRESFGIGIEKLQASCDAWSLPSNDITCHPFQTSLNSYGDNLVFGLLRDSPPNGLSGPRSWEDTVKSLANKQSSVPDIQPNPNLRKTSGNLQEPLGFESLEKYWRTA